MGFQFQGFNWESWRRDWWLELAPKAADLAACGVTTIWLPPPTQSVAPQGTWLSDKQPVQMRALGVWW